MPGYVASYANNGVIGGTITVTNQKLEEQLVVEKQWQNPDGSVKTEGLPGSINVQLWRKWETVSSGGGSGDNCTVNFYVNAKSNDPGGTTNVLVGSQEVAAGGYIDFYSYLTWGNKPTTVSPSGTAVITETGTVNPLGWLPIPTYRLSNITANQDVVIVMNHSSLWAQDVPNACVFTVTDHTEPGTGGGGGGGVTTVHEELVQTVVLNEAGNWKFGWDTLPANDGNGNTYYYYVKEADPPMGYSVTYNNNDGITGGLMTITNQTGFVLPETGGTGTIPYTMAGVILMLCAGLMYKKRLFRKGGCKSH